MTRRRAVLTSVLLGGAVLATTPAVWVRATARTALADEAEIAVTGLRAAPAVSAAGLLVLAAAVAMTIARRRGAAVAALAVLVGGGLAVGSAWSVLAGPEAAAEAGATVATGIGGLEEGVHTTPWVWLALVAGLGATALGGWAVVASRSWVPARFAADASGGVDSAAPSDAPAAWDALTRGEDPTA